MSSFQSQNSPLEKTSDLPDPHPGDPSSVVSIIEDPTEFGKFSGFARAKAEEEITRYRHRRACFYMEQMIDRSPAITAFVIMAEKPDFSNFYRTVFRPPQVHASISYWKYSRI